MLGLGFYKKDSREGDVPEEYQTGPYVPVATEDGDDDDDAEETKNQMMSCNCSKLSVSEGGNNRL